MSETPTIAPPQFRGAGGLEWAHWEEESVLYDVRSGQTHLLDAFSAEVLLALQERAMRVDALTGRIAHLLGRAGDEGLRLHVERALQQLLALGLVER